MSNGSIYIFNDLTSQVVDHGLSDFESTSSQFMSPLGGRIRVVGTQQIERALERTQQMLQDGVSIRAAYSGLRVLQPVVDNLASDARLTNGETELLGKYWRARCHVERDLRLSSLALSSGAKGLELTSRHDSRDHMNTRRRILDIMASAAAYERIPQLPDRLLNQARKLAVSEMNIARVDLATASINFRRGNYHVSVGLLTDRTIGTIADGHSQTLGAAALVYRAGASLHFNPRHSEKDLERAREIFTTANEGPRLIQRMELLEGQIAFLKLWGTRYDSDVLNLYDELQVYASMHGAQKDRLVRVRKFLPA